jgi:hypothetical protein
VIADHDRIYIKRGIEKPECARHRYRQMASEQIVSFCIADAQVGDVVRFLNDELAVEKRH